MSGHSKWSSIKHKKGAKDAQRGKSFTKVIREITVAAREGGGDVDANSRLRTAVYTARAINMPANNIERAIKKGTGELPGEHYESVTYEGYGPGGFAIMVEVLTNNKNRTHPELRKIFEKNNGNLSAAGCVAWMFTRRGEILVDKKSISEDKLMDTALEAGAEDIDSTGDEFYSVYTSIGDFLAVKDALEQHNIAVSSAQLAYIAQKENEVCFKENEAKKVLKLMEEIEDHDDVQNVYGNFDITD